MDGAQTQEFEAWIMCGEQDSVGILIDKRASARSDRDCSAVVDVHHDLDMVSEQDFLG